MKNLFYFLLFVALHNSFFTYAQEQTCDIKIEILGLKNTKGQIMITINKGPDGWPDSNFIEQRFIPNFTAPNFTVIFEKMPYGNYAVGVMHDEDKNGEMTYNFIGFPKESFGFTKDFKVVFRSPKYEESNFNVNSPEKTLQINLQN